MVGAPELRRKRNLILSHPSEGELIVASNEIVQPRDRGLTVEGRMRLVRTMEVEPGAERLVALV